MKRGEQAKLIKELQKEHGFPEGQPSKTIISRMVDKKDYRIFVTPKGFIDMDPTIKALLDSGFGERSKKVNATIGAKKGKPVAEPKTKPKKPAASDKEETTEDESQPLSMASTRARIEKHRAFQSAEKDRIANEVKLGKLIDLDDVSEKSFDLWRQVRDSIQSIHDRCAIKIRATESDHEAEQILKEEEARILNSIVEGFSNLNDSDLKKKLVLRLTK